ncbi:glyoxalase superfamily protein [Albibacillus kandeliae]|uniref:glyoxalase superfamily protein n=1 Tax=Albibacillus kandeliae TaxID=2174228 RepID=UPI000D68A012|nr:glyoxalase superfamily protein [Albibacillus kandeliae]
MTKTDTNDRIEELKAEARRLRATLAEAGTKISHSDALERIARQHGARDWNTLRAQAVTRTHNRRPLAVGDRVTGRYLGQPFTGYVYGMTHAEQSPYSRITLQFDEPVDVVTFDSFSAFRSRVSGVIDDRGQSLYRTSNGEPQIVVEHVAL